jgi:DNA-binding XRE family transcriptional regulator
MIGFKLAEGDWSWAVTPRAVLQVWDHTQLIAEIPAPFVLELVEQRLRDAVLQRRLAGLVEGEALEKLVRELEPRRVPMEPLVDLRPPRPPLGALRAARRAAGLTTRQLAEKAQISLSYARNLETDLASPSPAVARRLADALGLDVTDLFPTPAARRGEA